MEKCRKPLVTRRIVDAEEVAPPNGDELQDSEKNGGEDIDGDNGADVKMLDESEDYAHIYDSTTQASGSTKESSPEDDDMKPEEPELNVDEHGNIILPEGTKMKILINFTYFMLHTLCCKEYHRSKDLQKVIVFSRRH